MGTRPDSRSFRRPSGNWKRRWWSRRDRTADLLHAMRRSPSELRPGGRLVKGVHEASALPCVGFSRCLRTASQAGCRVCRGVGPAAFGRGSILVRRQSTGRYRPDNAVRCCQSSAPASRTRRHWRGAVRALRRPRTGGRYRGQGRRTSSHQEAPCARLAGRAAKPMPRASAFSRILAARIGPFPFLRPLVGKWCPPCRVPREAMGHGRQANLAQARSGPTRHHLT